jgi:small-conductance mechanosensitive channel
LQQSLGLRHRTRRLFKLWTRWFLDVVLFGAGLVLIVSVWGAPFDDLWFWVKGFAAGFKIGGMTISVVDILVGIGVFALVLMLSRLGQRLLAEKVLPRTRMDSGVQNSLAAGWWYVGVILAVVLGIAAIGIDLSSLALIAGALSVGIGFGLQNIANNFISGVILLIERPVKVGDWVVLGQNEGFVKQISLRSTEIETFQRASVILPNADIISNALVNWTHKDRYGRIEVEVTVGLHSDTTLVRDLLLAVAEAHPRVVAWPESNVLFKQIEGSGLTFELRCFTADVFYQFIIGSDLRYEILERLRAEGVEIPMPQRVVHYAASPTSNPGKDPSS